MSEKKKKLIFGAVFFMAVMAAVILLGTLQYRSYLNNYNARLSLLVERFEESHPELDRNEIAGLLTSEDTLTTNDSEASDSSKFWAKYGIDISKDSIINENRTAFRRGIFRDFAAVLIFGAALAGFFYLQQKRQLAETRRITGYLEKINCGDYSFDMQEMAEGEQSILENEVYKTTIMLREAAEQSQADKENLKDALSDISHQLKTPLTSMMINLDNLKEHPGMELSDRRRIINAARRDAGKMQKMIAQLLTLSRLDANVISFTREKARVIDLVRAAAENVEALADLKNIEVILPEGSDAEILCDAYWETEAIGNILKNGIEHAETKVSVAINDFELYREIVIENDGTPISEQDRKSIFKRFYQGESAGRESVGIGLSLAQVIVKNDGGHIVVESDENIPGSGTRFILRY